MWTAFAQRANQTKRQVQQTELAFCNPPQQRGKARYMNVDTLVAWGAKVLAWLDEPRPTGRPLDVQLSAFVCEQASRAGQGERLPGSSEVLESIIGKYKRLQGESGQFGVTGMSLSIGAFIGRLTLQGIRTALTTISGPVLRAWEETNLGVTIHSQRKQAFPSPPRGTKPGTSQLALTATN